MRMMTAVAIALLAVLPGIGAAAPSPRGAPKVGASAERYHLKGGATGKVCLGCHDAFQETLKKAFVHTPVRNGNCTDCHDPHASDHGKLLAEDPSRICLSCHTDVVPAKARSVHRDALEGRCVRCHDPHASASKGNLREGGNDLCLGCHKELAAGLAGARFKHSPAGKSCLTCHDPHAGEKTGWLLAREVPGLCLGCHKADLPAFRKAHGNYPVGTGDCGSCHDPHASNEPSLLWATVHAPVRNRMCSECHPAPGSPDAVRPKKDGVDACRACHGDTVSAALGDLRIHWPVLDRTACLGCHRPHAAREPRLLRAAEARLCGECHADAIARQARSETKHDPVAEGACSACHRPHSSGAVFLLDGADAAEVCARCHEWGKHSAHPLGPNVTDPRNRNLAVDCLSCHRTHGTPFKHLAHFDTKKELCLQCHADMGM